jgi:hypothetical protein
MTPAKYPVMTPDQYVASLPDERRETIAAIRKVINDNLKPGFEEAVDYGMLGWVVPHKLFPAGYHCDPTKPLSYMGLASQKNYISVYSMCLYGGTDLLEWFTNEWLKHSSKKLNMGKGCIRFTKTQDIPLDLIGELASRFTPQQWIEIYENTLANSRKR